MTHSTSEEFRGHHWGLVLSLYLRSLSHLTVSEDIFLQYWVCSSVAGFVRKLLRTLGSIPSTEREFFFPLVIKEEQYKLWRHAEKIFTTKT